MNKKIGIFTILLALGTLGLSHQEQANPLNIEQDTKQQIKPIFDVIAPDNDHLEKLQVEVGDFTGYQNKEEFDKAFDEAFNLVMPRLKDDRIRPV